MQHAFDIALPLVLAHEGGYVNHRADPGGPTNLGVTLATARRFGIDVDADGDTDIVDIRKLKVEHAAIVYRRGYWDAVRADDLPRGVDYATFDLAVHSGPRRAAIFLQRAAGVRDDGMIGPITLDAVHDADAMRLVRDICAQRLRFMQRLPTWKTFGRGWERRVNEVRSQAIKLVTDAPPKPRFAQGDPPEWITTLVRVLALAAVLGGLFLVTKGGTP